MRRAGGDVGAAGARFTAPVDTLDGLYEPGGEGRRVRLRTDVTQDLYDDEFERHADYVEMADAASGRGEGAWSACAGDFHEALDLP